MSVNYSASLHLRCGHAARHRHRQRWDISSAGRSQPVSPCGSRGPSRRRQPSAYHIQTWVADSLSTGRQQSAASSPSFLLSFSPRYNLVRRVPCSGREGRCRLPTAHRSGSRVRCRAACACQSLCLRHTGWLVWGSSRSIG